jgi:hypothetical protein
LLHYHLLLPASQRVVLLTDGSRLALILYAELTADVRISRVNREEGTNDHAVLLLLAPAAVLAMCLHCLVHTLNPEDL